MPTKLSVVTLRKLLPPRWSVNSPRSKKLCRSAVGFESSELAAAGNAEDSVKYQIEVSLAARCLFRISIGAPRTISKCVATTVVQRRQQTIDTTRDVAWLSHLNPPFSVVLTETTVEHSLGPFVHLGWGMRNQRRGRPVRQRRRAGWLFSKRPLRSGWRTGRLFG